MYIYLHTNTHIYIHKYIHFEDLAVRLSHRLVMAYLWVKG